MIDVSVSAHADPLNNPNVDAVVDLAVTPLGVVPNIQLYAQAVDDADPGASFTYQWLIIGAPSGSGASIINPNSQNPQVTGLDTWGNLVLHCVATNTATGRTSLMRDPNTSVPSPLHGLGWDQFVVIHVREANHGLERPAPSERNTVEAQHAYMEIVATSETAPVLLGDLGDINTATGPQVDALTGGGDAAGLHTHTGADISKAAVGTLGVAQLSDAPVDGVNPVALNRDKVVLSGCCETSLRQMGVEPVILPHSDGRQYHLAWYIQENMTLTAWAISMRNGGKAGAPYTFELLTGNSTALEGKTLASFGAPQTLSGSPLTDGAPLARVSAALGVAIAKENWLAVKVTGGDAQTPGKGLDVTLWLERRV